MPGGRLRTVSRGPVLVHNPGQPLLHLLLLLLVMGLLLLPLGVCWPHPQRLLLHRPHILECERICTAAHPIHSRTMAAPPCHTGIYQ